MLRTHCQTSGASLTEQDPYNNVIRTTIEALAAVLGGTQSLHTNALRRGGRAAHAVLRAHRAQHAAHPRRGDRHPARDRPARRLVLRGEPHRVDRARGAGADRRGRGARRHDARRSRPGMPKLRIEEAAARRQARIDRGEDVVVGVNNYQAPTQSRVEILRHRQHGRAREADRAPGAASAATRDAASVPRGAGARSTSARAAAEGNLLELAVAAARARATVGEISSALETRVRAATAREMRTISGVYGGAYRGRRRSSKRVPRGRGVRDGGRPPAAHPGRQARPGRPRPRREGDRHRRSPTWASTSTSAPLFQTPEEVGAPGDRERRARRRRLDAGGRPQHARAAARRGAARARARGDIVVRVRRRDPAAGLRVPAAATASRTVFGPGTHDPARRARGARARSDGAARDERRRLDRARTRTSPACARATGACSPRRSRCSRAGAPSDRELGAGGARRARAAHGRRDPPRHHAAPPGRGQEHVHRGARAAPDRAGPARRRARRRPVEPASPAAASSATRRAWRSSRERARRSSGRRLPAGRSAASRSARARRCSLRGRRLRRRARRDGRRRASREVEVALDGRLLRGAAPAGRRRRAAGHQEGRARARRRARREQGRRRAARRRRARTRAEYAHALALLQPAPPPWTPPWCSAPARAPGDGHRGVLGARSSRSAQALQSSGELERRRRAQPRAWLWRLLDDGLAGRVRADPQLAAETPAISRQRWQHEPTGRRAPRASCSTSSRARSRLPLIAPSTVSELRAPMTVQIHSGAIDATAESAKRARSR